MSTTESVRQRCGVITADHRSVLRMVGSDRIVFLQGMLSNDVKALTPGQGTHATMLTQQGKLVAIMRVYCLEEEVWLDTPATRAEALRAALERFIVADDVEFADADTCQPLLSLEGPQAARVALAVFGEALDDLPLYSHRLCAFEGESVRVACVTHTGERGLLVMGAPTLTESLRTKCLAAGAEDIDAQTLDVLRVEAGIPCFGHDMDDSTLVSEVGLSDAISFSKGCYLGQEVVERVAARGQVQKKLVGLVCEGVTVPASGRKLSVGDQEVGRITSAVYSTTLQSTIALAYVRREHWEIGTTLKVADGGEARVVATPFLPRG